MQEAARVALRERQLREQRYAHLNSIKIHNQWRKIMRMAKVEELRREIEILSQNHEREVDRKVKLEMPVGKHRTVQYVVSKTALAWKSVEIYDKGCEQ